MADPSWGEPGSLHVELVAAVELVRVQLPLAAPFVAAHGTEEVRDVVLVRLRSSDGHEGWGECSTLSRPGYSPEWTDDAWHALADTLAPMLLAGGAWWDPARPMASAGIEEALADLAARRAGISLAELLGGTRRRVEATAVVGMTGSVEELVDTVAARVAAGHRSVKLKIEPGHDLAPLAEVRRRWPELSLAADANGSYDQPSDVPVEQLERLGLAYLEQPLAPADIDGSALLGQRCAVPIALDESVGTLDDLGRAIEAGAVAIVNVKPARLGGLAGACAAARVAEAAGIGAFVGGMLETGVGRAAALAVASLSACSLPTDLGPSSRYFTTDVTEPIEADDGWLEVPSRVGIGVELRPDALERHVVARTTCTR